jgi:hypothetical protein
MRQRLLPFGKLALMRKDILSLPLSWKATARCHLERGPIVWDWASVGVWEKEQSQLRKSWDTLQRCLGERWSWEVIVGWEGEGLTSSCRVQVVGSSGSKERNAQKLCPPWWPLNLCYKRYWKESYTQKRKINATMKILEGINLIRQVDKQRTSKEELSTIVPIKWVEVLHTFQ